MEKSTHVDKITLYQPLVKNSEGKYLAILSDDSIDRQGELMSKEAFQDILKADGYTAILFDHENKIMNQVGEWVNKRIEVIDGHHTLIAEPKFYQSNPNAKILQGMLDEGAKMGVSIGALPKKWVQKTIDGVKRTVYTSLELLEASFVAIPANKHGMATAISKMMKTNQQTEEQPMDDELTKKFESEKADLQKSISTLTEEKSALEKNYTDAKEQLDKALSTNKELEKSIADLKKDHDQELKKATEEKAELEKSLETEKKKALYKGNQFQELDEKEKDSIGKSLEEGQVPVLTR